MFPPILRGILMSAQERQFACDLHLRMQGCMWVATGFIILIVMVHAAYVLALAYVICYNVHGNLFFDLQVTSQDLE